MDEQTWLSGAAVHAMLRHLCSKERNAGRTKVGRRKLRLFCVACFRQIQAVLTEPALRLVASLEQAAEGQAPERESPRLYREAEEHVRLCVDDDTGFPHHAGAAVSYAAFYFGSPGLAAERVSIYLRHALGFSDPPHKQTHPELVQPHSVTERRQADLLREVFGNPFRPLRKRKFPAEVRGLAQACYDDPAHYPLLADALTDLGEDEAAEHCRSPGHVKGCHVVDWVLGRA